MPAGDRPGGAGQRRRRAWPHAATALILAFAMFYLADTVADPDIWGHVRFGQDILRAGTIPREDPYSFLTTGATWINHEWLAEVAFAMAYRQAGTPGLIGLKLFVSLLIVVLVIRHLRREGLGPIGAALVTLVMVIPLRIGLGTIRPHLFTYLGFLLTLLMIRACDRGRTGWLWASPGLFAVWTNLHGGFLAGLSVLGVWGALRMIGMLRRSWSAAATIGLVVIASCVATLANPYGADLLRFLLRTATVPRPEITEWRPLPLVSLRGGFYLVLLALAGLGTVASRRPRSGAGLGVLGLMALAPLVADRHLPLFVLAAAVLPAGHLADVWQRATLRWGWPPCWLATLASLPLWLAALALALMLPLRLTCIRLDPGYWRFPTAAVGILKESGVGGDLVVPYNWGEYAIWHLAPPIRSRWMVAGKRSIPSRSIRSNWSSAMAWVIGTRSWSGRVWTWCWPTVAMRRST